MSTLKDKSPRCSANVIEVNIGIFIFSLNVNGKILYFVLQNMSQKSIHFSTQSMLVPK